MNQEMLTTADVAVTAVLPGAYEDLSQAVGQIARQEVVTGQQITSAVTGPSSGGSTTQIDTPAGFRAMSVMVDQISGVGTLIKPGDWVDMVIRMDVKPVVVSEDGTSATAVDAVDGDTSKLLLQGMQVLGTLLPPPPATTEGATPAPGTALQERQELVILATDGGADRGREVGPERCPGLDVARAPLAGRLCRRQREPHRSPSRRASRNGRS